MADLNNWGQHGELRSDVPYGQHIRLYCTNHPELGANWSTKNIAPIGARSIFWFGPYNLRECNCSGSALRVAPDDMHGDC